MRTVTPRRLVVLVPAHDEESHIARTLDSVAAQELPADLEVEVVVLENGSRDRTLETAQTWIRDRAPATMRFQVESVPVRGKARALNHGLEKYPAPLHLLLDADVAISKDLIARLHARFQDPAIRVAGPTGRMLVEGLVKDSVMQRYLHLEERLLELRYATGVFLPPGCCLMVEMPPDLRLATDVTAEDYWLLLEMLHRHGAGALAVEPSVQVRYWSPTSWPELIEQLARWNLGVPEILRKHPHLEAAWNLAQAREHAALPKVEQRRRAHEAMRAEGWSPRDWNEALVVKRVITEHARHLARARRDPQLRPSQPSTKGRGDGRHTGAARAAAKRAAPAPVRGADEALIEAAAAGDLERVRRRLRAGADVSAAGREGRTALHAAAAGKHPGVAALLLYHGADFTVPDRDGRRALDPAHVTLELLHAIRQRYRRVRRAPVVPSATIPERIAKQVQEFREKGILRVDGLVKPARLEKLLQSFARFMERMSTLEAKGEGFKQKYDEEEHIWNRDRAYVTNNAFRDNPALARLCCEPDLLRIVDLYLGGPAFIQRGVGMRYLPFDAKQIDMFQWHHDMEESRVKMMVLLTDVGPKDQRMSYVLGSQHIYHPYKMFFSNECPLAYVERHQKKLEIFDTVGKAGDVFLFDSNGAHRGNRSAGAVLRDAYFVEFTIDPSDIWGGDVPRAALQGIPGRNPFGKMTETPKKWTVDRPVRTDPTWVEDLPDIGRWRTYTVDSDHRS